MSEVSALIPPALGRVGRYTIFEEMAEGGMARVFLAQKEGSHQLCVLKQLHGELEQHDTAAIRFQREAHIVSQLNHPNIAHVVDAGLEDGKFCIAMELVEGVTLRQVLDEMDQRNQILPPSITLGIGVQALEGLSYAHALRDAGGRHLGIVHRDLSPKNVMVGYDGRVKIIDFGVAQGRIDNFRTAPGMIVGTLHYMSPEQAMTDEIDHRSDLYTLSVVLWELLAGQPMVRDGKAVEVLEQVISEEPPRLREIDPGLPPAICGVIERGLEKDPKDRWQSAVSYREALRQAIHPIDSVSLPQIGEFVRHLLPPEDHPVRRWLAHVAVDPSMDFPTLGDDALQAAEVASTIGAIPAPSASSSQTLPDQPTLSDGQITRPDTPAPDRTALEKLHTLAVQNERLKKTIARQGRIIRWLLAAILGIGLAWTAAAFGLLS